MWVGIDRGKTLPQSQQEVRHMGGVAVNTTTNITVSLLFTSGNGSSNNNKLAITIRQSDIVFLFKTKRDDLRVHGHVCKLLVDVAIDVLHACKHLGCGESVFVTELFGLQLVFLAH